LVYGTDPFSLNKKDLTTQVLLIGGGKAVYGRSVGFNNALGMLKGGKGGLSEKEYGVVRDHLKDLYVVYGLVGELKDKDLAKRLSDLGCVIEPQGKVWIISYLKLLEAVKSRSRNNYEKLMQDLLDNYKAASTSAGAKKTTSKWQAIRDAQRELAEATTRAREYWERSY